MVGSSGVWRVGCMWRVEECEVECVRMDGEMMGIYTIYIYILFIYFFNHQGYVPPCRLKTTSNTQSLSSNNRKE